MNLVIAMAGHVDHGKTALSKALTGINTDTLPEEKRRGITITPGYAPFSENAVIVDMPGHEKFVTNMALAAHDISCAVICVDAREGVMPQTKEHIKILCLLEADSAVVALTKCDIAQQTEIDEAKRQIYEAVFNTPFINAPIFLTSAKLGTGIDELKNYLSTLTSADHKREGCFYMPLDRVFIKNGFGTIAAGTVFQGKANKGDVLYCYPSGEKYTVKTIECGGRAADNCEKGRAALCVRGKTQALKKGAVLCGANGLIFKKAIIIRLQSDEGLKSGEMLQMVLGSKEYTVRISIFGNFAFVKAEQEIAACYMQKLLLKKQSEYWGGEVLVSVVNNETRLDKREKERLAAYDKGIDSAAEYEMRHGSVSALHAHMFYLTAAKLKSLAEKYISEEQRSQLKQDTEQISEAYFASYLSPPYLSHAAASLSIPESRALAAAEVLCERGRLIYLCAGLYIHEDAFNEMQRECNKIINENGGVTVAQLRDRLCLTRKYCRAFLEYCDAKGIYSNIDNVRKAKNL